MRLLVPGATAAVRELYPVRPDRLGLLLMPGKGMVTSMVDGVMPFAADNGCFTRLDAPAFLRMLAYLAGCPHRPLFVTCPDVVADAVETLRRFSRWGPVVRELGLPAALVAQDGLTTASVPWGDVDALFVGGSTAWKLSGDAESLVRAAKGRGLHTHMGRVNSMRRIELAARWGCDSIDGTGFTWFSDTRIPLAIRWIDRGLRQAKHQPLLF